MSQDHERPHIAARTETEEGTGRRKRFRVRYKDAAGRHRSKSFTTKTDAKAFLGQAIDAEQRRRTLGTHGLDLGPEREMTTLGEWPRRWVASHPCRPAAGRGPPAGHAHSQRKAS